MNLSIKAAKRFNGAISNELKLWTAVASTLCEKNIAYGLSLLNPKRRESIGSFQHAIRRSDPYPSCSLDFTWCEIQGLCLQSCLKMSQWFNSLWWNMFFCQWKESLKVLQTHFGWPCIVFTLNKHWLLNCWMRLSMVRMLVIIFFYGINISVSGFLF